MPLNKPALKSGLKSLSENLSADPPTTAAECATAWADAVAAYASAIVPASTQVTTAAAALEGALTTAFGKENALPDMETAFAAFAATVGGGMAPAFSATPPPEPVGFADQTDNLDTSEQFAETYANLIHGWLTSGTAVPSGGGSPVNWS